MSSYPGRKWKYIRVCVRGRVHEVDAVGNEQETSELKESVERRWGVVHPSRWRFLPFTSFYFRLEYLHSRQGYQRSSINTNKNICKCL